MGVTIEGKRVIERIAKDRLDSLKKEFPKAIEQSVSRMVNRASKGIDKNNRYTPYSDAYREKRKAAGYSGRVNLQVSGDMLKNITHEETKTATGLESTISFNNAVTVYSEKERGVLGKGSATVRDKARWVSALRPFFGFTTRERQTLIKQLIDALRGKK